MLLHTVVMVVATLSAQELLDRSIAYHDPHGQFESGAFQIALSESRPNGADRKTSVTIDNGSGRFEMTREADTGASTHLVTRGDEVETNSDADLPDDRALRTRNYYAYLYGLPMKLRDPGTKLAPDAKETTFRDQKAWELKVTYDESVGQDTWYFYLDPTTYALIGYRFYHDESKNDGEYITLEGEAQGAGLRLPKIRNWYRHADEGHLGTDTIVSIKEP